MRVQHAEYGGGGRSRRVQAAHHQYSKTDILMHVEQKPLPRHHYIFQQARDYISPFLKYLLFSFNFLFWLCGIGIAGLGMWILTEKNKQIRDAFDIVFDPSILFCASGCMIFALGFFGCLGALRENNCLLKTFHLLLTIVLLLELCTAVLIFVFYYVPVARQQVNFFNPEKILRQAIVKYRDDDDLRDAIDAVQREFQCCGLADGDTGYKDWRENVYFNCSDDNPSVERCGVPHSCCKQQKGLVNVMCGFDTTNKDKSTVEDRIFVQGCLKGFGAWLDKNTLIIGIISTGIIIPQIMGICLARSLIEQINQQKRQWMDSL